MTLDPRQLKLQLPHTWPAFFAAHGSFTDVQTRALPVILGGRDALIVAATASGKTEAAVAPLLERYLKDRQPGLRLLYVCPTRSLVRDLHERLVPPLRRLGVTLAMKSGDTGPVSARRPPTVLITTPESTDSLLTRAPRLLTTLQALVLDEVHLFDDSPRGDHVRCLLQRLETVRDYATPGTPPAQRVALSATLAEPEAVARRYLHDGAVVAVAGGRRLEADLQPMYDLDDLVSALAQRAVRKTLVFCNTRNEVEEVASYLRARLPYEASVLVHYSNLDRALRREVETRFAESSVAVCVSSSTLELGVDIGSIDEVALVGPPATLSSFLQRVGRGGRRAQRMRVLCLARSPGEMLRFKALLTLAERPETSLPPKSYHFRRSVIVQQIFSLLKQSPTGSLRLADLHRTVPESFAEGAFLELLEHLRQHDYLSSGRPGTWRAGAKLNELADEHEIYSNIGGEALGATLIDAYSGRPIAQADRPRHQGERLLLGGRSVEVAWQDRYRVGVQQGRHRLDETMRFHTAPAAIPLEVAQGVAAELGLRPGQLPYLVDDRGAWLFHFWGDVFGELLAALLRAQFSGPGQEPPAIAPWNEFCLSLPFALASLPPWDDVLVQAAIEPLVPYFTRLLEPGRFFDLLPAELARQEVIEQLELPRLQTLYRAARLLEAPSGLGVQLQRLL